MQTLQSSVLLGGYPFHLLSQSSLAFAATADNTVVLTAAAAPLTLSVLAPSDYAGSYPLDAAGLGTGPVALRPPEIAGTPAVGMPLEARSALWAYDGAALAPSRGWQWQSDGVDIPGATDPVFTPEAAHAGTTLRVVETAQGAGGLAGTVSAGVAVPV